MMSDSFVLTELSSTAAEEFYAAIDPATEHLAPRRAWSEQRGDTLQRMRKSARHHPLIEESLRTALRVLQRALPAIGR